MMKDSHSSERSVPGASPDGSTLTETLRRLLDVEDGSGDTRERAFTDQHQDHSHVGARRVPPASSAPEEEAAQVRPADLPKVGTAAVAGLALLFVVMLTGLFVLGYLPHRRLQAEFRAEAADGKDGRPVVNAVVPTRQNRATNLVLPADIQAFQHTSICPRTNGYLKRLLVDIGDRVHAGQLLAEIDTPEVDAQLNQARAAVEQSKANLEKARMTFALAQTTLRRYQDAVKSGGVAQQDFDEKSSQLDQARASLNVANAAVTFSQAEVQRLEALQGFEKVTAPFDGIICARNYDIGALLAATGTGSGKELFQIDQTDTLRVFVKVPQAYATAVQPGQKAALQVRNYPGRSFEGRVTRFAGSIDPTTRTLRVEIDVPNRENLLFGGMYGQIKLDVTNGQPPLLVPTNALVYNADGLSLAVVRGGKIHFQKVSTGRDLGAEIEILEGLAGDELVVSNPGEQIREGCEVQAVLTARGGAATSRPAPSVAMEK
jgi:RND family efflux transporter MFP subunit